MNNYGDSIGTSKGSVWGTVPKTAPDPASEGPSSQSMALTCPSRPG